MERYALRPIESTCPICRSHQAILLYSVNSSQAAQHFMLREADPQRFEQLQSCIQALWRQAACNVVRCEHCEFCYSDPFIAGDDVFYSLVYSGSVYPHWRWEYQLTLQMIMTLGRADFTLLEVGAGDGSFLKRITPALTRKDKIVCTEFSTYGAQALTEYGITCLSTDIRKWSSTQFKAHFDTICMFQVLEHLDNLEALFERLAWIAKSDAALFISVPNPKRIEFHELNGALLDMPPHHVGRWNRKGLEIMAKRYGWTVEGHEIETTESLAAKAIKFSIYRFKRQSQNSRTLANWIKRLQNRRLRRLAQLIGIATYSVPSIPALYKLRARELGGTQWLYLRRTTG